MTKILNLLVALSLTSGFVSCAPAYAGAPPPGTEKSRVRRACEAGLTRLGRARDKMAEYQTDLISRALRWMVDDRSFPNRLHRWSNDTFEKLPDGVKKLVRPTPEALEFQRKIEFAVAWHVMKLARIAGRAPELFKTRATRIDHNTRTLSWAAIPTAAEASPEDRENLERLIDQALEGRHEFPLYADASLFRRGKRFLQRYAAGTRVVLEDGLVIEDETDPRIETKEPHLVTQLMLGRFPISSNYQYSLGLPRPEPRAPVAAILAPANVREVAREIVRGTPSSLREFNVRELAKATISGPSEDAAGLDRVKAEIASFARAALEGNYENLRNFRVERPVRLFVRNEWHPRRFEAGTKLLVNDWMVIDWSR